VSAVLPRCPVPRKFSENNRTEEFNSKVNSFNHEPSEVCKAIRGSRIVRLPHPFIGNPSECAHLKTPSIYRVV
jgi:hypothetical protein